jgi:hypothetical protein
MIRDSDRMIQEKAVSLEQLRTLANSGNLYALLDACDEPAVPKRCRQMTAARAVSLYRGDAAVEFGHVAPYLAHLNPDDIDWILAKLWSAPWGYFVIARSDLATLRTHFRHFLKVKLPDNTKVLFRFYDPRVVRTYLDASDLPTRRQFFGPVQALGLTQAGTPDWIQLLTQGP